jgi:hypothetical protein
MHSQPLRPTGRWRWFAATRWFGSLTVAALLAGSCGDRQDPVGLDGSRGALLPGVGADFSVATDATGWGGVQLRGSATVSPEGFLRLTEARPDQSGAAWHPRQQTLGEGFTTTFQFRIQNGTTPAAEGFAFLIRNASQGFFQPATCSGCLGYSGLPQSLAVEFDISSSDRSESSNHIAVHSGGKGPNRHTSASRLGSTDLNTSFTLPPLSPGIHTARIQYTPGTLRVFVGFLGDLPGLVLTVPVDLAKLGVLDSSGRGWVGFSAATGSTNSASHDILDWTLSGPGNNTGGIAGTVINSETSAPIPGVQVSLATGVGVDVTDVDGRYSLSGIPAGPHTVVINDPRYEAFSANVNVSAGALTPLNIQLVPIYTVTVTVVEDTPAANPPVLPGILVTVTNIQTGEPHYGRTGTNGQAAFPLRRGEYIFTARPVATSLDSDLQIWPVGNKLSVPADPRPFVGGVFDPRNRSSLDLTAENFNVAYREPYEIRAGANLEITIALRLGATIACTLLDANGDPIQGSDQVFGILPHINTRDLPPVSAEFRGNRALQRGVGYRVGNSIDGRCSLPGAPMGNTVLETPPIQTLDGPVVYVMGLNIGENDQTSGNTVRTVGAPLPILKFRSYYVDEVFGDARGNNEIGGVITHGWRESGEFVVSSGFQGWGNYTLQLFTSNPGSNPSSPTYSITAVCAKTCSVQSRSSNLPTGSTAWGVSAGNDDDGTVVWQVPIPNNPPRIWFRIIGSGGSGVGDSTEVIEALQMEGTGNTFLIMSGS